MERGSGKYINLEGLQSEIEEHKHLLFLANRFTMTDNEVGLYRLSLQLINELGKKLTHKQIELMKFWEIEEEKRLGAADKIKELTNITLITGERNDNINAWRRKYLNDFEIALGKFKEATSQIDKIQKQTSSITEEFGITSEDIIIEKKTHPLNPRLQTLLNSMFSGDKKK